MAYPHSGSTLKSGISTGLSTQIIITVNDIGGHEIQIGAIQSIDEKQTRPLQEVGEVGTDGILEIVPTKWTSYSISLSRTMFDGISLTQAFGRGFRNIQSQRFPFDIKIFDLSMSMVSPSDAWTPPGNDDGATPKILTVYKNCWFSDLGTPYKCDNYIIVQSATVKCEGIFTSVMTSGDQAAGIAVGTAPLAGARGVPIAADPIEMFTDSQRRLGSMDFAGLINASGLGGDSNLR